MKQKFGQFIILAFVLVASLTSAKASPITEMESPRASFKAVFGKESGWNQKTIEELSQFAQRVVTTTSEAALNYGYYCETNLYKVDSSAESTTIVFSTNCQRDPELGKRQVLDLKFMIESDVSRTLGVPLEKLRCYETEACGRGGATIHN